MRNPEYPKYIKNEQNDNKENVKRYFRRIASNYELDTNNELYIKYYKNNKIKQSLKDNKDYILCKIPFEKNIIEYLLKLHNEMCHRSGESLRKELLNKNIYYFGIIKDIKKAIMNVEYAL